MADDILAILTELRRDAFKTATPLALLERATGVFFNHLPLERVLFYRASGTGIFAWYDSRKPDEQSFITLSKYPKYEEILLNGGWDYSHPLLIVALQADEQPFGLVEFELKERISPAVIANLETLVQQLSTHLDNVQLRQLVQRQVDASSALNTATNFEDIARVLGRYAISKGQFISINLFDFDADGVPVDVRIVATASSSFAQSTNTSVGASPEAVKSLYEMSFASAQEPAIYPETDPRLNEYIREWLRSVHVKSLYALALRKGGKAYGLISLNDTVRPLALTHNEITVFRSLVEQAGAVIENRQLIDTVASNLEDMRSLYEMSSNLLLANDIPEMLKILYRTVGQGVRSISMVDIGYDNDMIAKSFIIRHVVDPKGNLVSPNAPVFTDLTDEASERITNYMSSSGDELDLVEDMTQSTAPMTASFIAQGIKSSITIPIWEQDRRVSQISLTWTTSRAFDDRLRRILATIQLQFTLVLQNKRLLEESRERAEQSVEQVRVLSILNELATITNTQQDETALLDATTKSLKDAVRADHVAIVLIDERRNVGVVRSEFPDTHTVGMVLSPDDTITDLMRQTRQPVLIENVPTDSHLNTEARDALVKMGILSLFVVPIFNLEDTLMGSISFDIFRANVKPDVQSIELAKTIGLQLALNLQKLRLFANTQRQTRQVQKINAFGQSVQATQDIPTIMSVAFEYLRDITYYDYATLHIYNRDQRVMGMAARHMYNDLTVFDTPQAIVLDQNTIIQHVWNTSQSLDIDDLNAEVTWLHPMRGVIQSIISLPLIVNGRAYGVMEVASYEPYSYSNAENDVLRQMANQITVALDNADAYIRSQQQSQLKTRANEISARLQQQADVDGMLRIAIQEIGSALGAKRGRIRLTVNTPEQEQS